MPVAIPISPHSIYPQINHCEPQWSRKLGSIAQLGIPARPVTIMSDEDAVRKGLAEIGLGEYVERFIEEGFDTWATVKSVTESDLYVESLNTEVPSNQHR